METFSASYLELEEAYMSMMGGKWWSAVDDRVVDRAWDFMEWFGPIHRAANAARSSIGGRRRGGVKSRLQREAEKAEDAALKSIVGGSYNVPADFIVPRAALVDAGAPVDYIARICLVRD